jgi:hypothetical protein
VGYRVYDEDDLVQRWMKETIEDLRGLVIHDGRSWGEIAQEALLSYQTVKKFAEDKTRRPHWNTLTRLAMTVNGGSSAFAAKLRDLADLVESGDIGNGNDAKVLRLIGGLE